MPASSQGLPTSLMRVDRLAARRAGDAHLVDPRPMRGVALERVPAADRPLVQLVAPADDLDRAARRAVVDRQRQPPVALLADHPVVHVAEPVELPVVAEVGDPPDVVDDVHDLVAQAGVDLLLRERLARLVVDRAHADEPLVDEPEQERGPAPPAVRIAVRVRLEVVEEAAPLEVVDDRLGDVRRVEAGQPAEARDVASVLVDGADQGQPEGLAELVVLGAAARGDVDDARALVLADLGPGHDPMLVAGLGEGRARWPAARRTGRDSASPRASDPATSSSTVKRPWMTVLRVPLPTHRTSSPARTLT